MPGRELLPFALARAADRLTARLLVQLEADGWPRLNRSQLVLLDLLPGAGSHPAQLARELDMTRQSMQQLLAVLEQAGLVRLALRDDDRRSKTVQLTADGEAMVAAVRGYIRLLEQDLVRLIGRTRLDLLHRSLEEWGQGERPGALGAGDRRGEDQPSTRTGSRPSQPAAASRTMA